MADESPLKLDFDAGPAFSWAAIGLAVLTAILQGLVAAMTSMTESSGQWTFRFRLALVEHYWWTFVALMLFCSLVMSIIAFVSGRGGDPVSVLALSSATFLAVIQYALPAWQQRHYTKTRWYAWTGDSRTAIKKEYAPLCRNAASWARLAAKSASARSRLQPTPSDYYGWRLWHVAGIRPDPTDILRVIKDPSAVDSSAGEKGERMVGIFEPRDGTAKTVSFIWGRRQGFTPRLSRAVMSMPLSLLKSSPTTMDGYNGKGLTVAMGILGRNKGLQPWKLVFKAAPATRDLMEATSTWTPRPAKVLRSFYKHAMDAQYKGLGEGYVDAAVELALLLVDMPNYAIDSWLLLGLEHQSIEVNNLLAHQVLSGCSVAERNAILVAHYESSYAAMIMSLNSMDPAVKAVHKIDRLFRPDLLCTALLCWKQGLDVVHLFMREDAQNVLRQEMESVLDLAAWKTTAALLVGLNSWPVELNCLLGIDEEKVP